MNEVQKLASDIFDSFEPAFFQRCANHAIKIAENFWSKVDHLIDFEVERLEIPLNSDSSDDDDGFLGFSASDSASDEY